MQINALPCKTDDVPLEADPAGDAPVRRRCLSVLQILCHTTVLFHFRTVCFQQEHIGHQSGGSADRIKPDERL